MLRPVFLGFNVLVYVVQVRQHFASASLSCQETSVWTGLPSLSWSFTNLPGNFDIFNLSRCIIWHTSGMRIYVCRTMNSARWYDVLVSDRGRLHKAYLHHAAFGCRPIPPLAEA